MPPRAVDELVDALHLARGVRRIRREDVVRDDGVTFHAGQSSPGRRRTSSVTSGRAKNRNGTNVVPVPGETCIVPASVS